MSSFIGEHDGSLSDSSPVGTSFHELLGKSMFNLNKRVCCSFETLFGYTFWQFFLFFFFGSLEGKICIIVVSVIIIEGG